MTGRMRLAGHFRHEAESVHAWARMRGMSRPRAWIVAVGASYGKAFWTFQRTIANFVGYSVRTVQRAMRQAKRIGLLTSRRIKRGETAPGGRGPLTCGAALRSIVGWGCPEAQSNALRAQASVRESYRLAALENRAERDRLERRAAVAEFHELPEV